jgi:hypothetical protein
MTWTNKDFTDLQMMALGACIGVAVFGFWIAPLLGLEFVAHKPVNYMMTAVAGTIGGFVLRFGVAYLRTRND